MKMRYVLLTLGWCNCAPELKDSINKFIFFFRLYFSEYTPMRKIYIQLSDLLLKNDAHTT